MTTFWILTDMSGNRMCVKSIDVGAIEKCIYMCREAQWKYSKLCVNSFVFVSSIVLSYVWHTQDGRYDSNNVQHRHMSGCETQWEHINKWEWLAEGNNSRHTSYFLFPLACHMPHIIYIWQVWQASGAQRLQIMHIDCTLWIKRINHNHQKDKQSSEYVCEGRNKVQECQIKWFINIRE